MASFHQAKQFTVVKFEADYDHRSKWSENCRRQQSLSGPEHVRRQDRGIRLVGGTREHFCQYRTTTR